MDCINKNLCDDVLLQQLQLGNKDAFNVLYKKYWEVLYANAYRRLKDSESAKDVVQEIFTHLWLKRETTAIENLPAYLNVAVRNKVFKLLTKQKQTHPFFTVLESAPAPFFNADTNLLWKEFLKSYEALLSTLPSKRQLIFRLRFQDDLSTTEIATQLRLSRNTVQNQLGKAVEQLRVSLDALTAVFIVIWAVGV